MRTAGFVFRRESFMLAEIQQNVGGLADQQFAGFQERRRERRMRDAAAVQHFQHRRRAAVPACAEPFARRTLCHKKY